MPIGRPPKDPPEPERFYAALHQAARMYASLTSIAAFFNVSRSTFNRWRDQDELVDVLIAHARAERLARIDFRMEREALAGDVSAARVMYSRLGEPLQTVAPIPATDPDDTLAPSDFADAIFALQDTRREFLSDEEYSRALEDRSAREDE